MQKSCNVLTWTKNTTKIPHKKIKYSTFHNSYSYYEDLKTENIHVHMKRAANKKNLHRQTNSIVDKKITKLKKIPHEKMLLKVWWDFIRLYVLNCVLKIMSLNITLILIRQKMSSYISYFICDQFILKQKPTILMSNVFLFLRKQHINRPIRYRQIVYADSWC